jgi:hypothetical protein
MLTSSSSFATFSGKKKSVGKKASSTGVVVRSANDLAEYFQQDKSDITHFWEGVRYSFAINTERIKTGARVTLDETVEQRIKNNLRQRRNAEVLRVKIHINQILNMH